MFNKFYQDELVFLRDMGREFAAAYPEAAHFVGETGRDPDVERMIEGFAFLAARLRQKLEDELPEITHAFVEMFFPHYLRPTPSMTVVQFEAMAQAAKEVRAVPRGTLLESVPVDGTPCTFRTCYDVQLVPFTLESAQLRSEAPPSLRLRFRLPDGVPLKKVPLSGLRLYLSGDAAVTRAIYVCLCRYLKRVTALPVAGAAPGNPVLLGDGRARPAGFDADDLLLPFPAGSFPGFRLLHEYFAFPPKFMFVDVPGMEALASLGDATAFELTFELTRLPDPMPPVAPQNFLLHCTPAINLFQHDADPIRLDHKRVDYRIRPAGRDAAHFEIYTVDRVVGIAKGTAKPREYHPLFRLARPAAPDARFYRHRVAPPVVGEGTDVLLSVLLPDRIEDLPEEETLSLELTCTNRNLPSRLEVGQVSVPTASSPTFARFRNLSRPTPSLAAPLGDDLHWRLLSHMAVNYLSLTDLDALRAMLRLYHFRARTDRQAEQALRLVTDGLRKLTARPSTRLLDGMPVRGISVELEVDEDNLGGEGEAFLFGSVLDEFFSQYVTLNAFSRLTLKAMKRGEIHTWPARIGRRIIL